MMEFWVGMSPDLLLQLWLVFEGFSLWKILQMPDKVGVVPTDFSVICESISQGEGSFSEKVDKVNEFKVVLKNYNFWKPIVAFLEKTHLEVFLLIALVLASLIVKFETPVVRGWLTCLLGVYMFLKFVIYQFARHAFSNYQRQLKELVPVSLPQDKSLTFENLDIHN